MTQIEQEPHTAAAPTLSEKRRQHWQNPQFAAKMIALRRTDEFREKISKKQGSVLIRAWPIILRQDIIDKEEILQITGLKEKQVDNLLTLLRRKNRLAKLTEEQKKQTRIRAHIGRPRSGHRQYSPEQRNSFALAGKLLDSDLISKDLTNWRRLHEIYQTDQRQLPTTLAHKIILEVTLRVIKNQAADPENFRAFRKICNRHHPGIFEWLEDEMLFLKTKTEGLQALDDSEILWLTDYSRLKEISHKIKTLIDGGQLPRHDTMSLQKLTMLGVDVQPMEAKTVTRNYYRFQEWLNKQPAKNNPDQDLTNAQFARHLETNCQLLENIVDPNKRNLYHLTSSIKKH